MFLSTDHWTVLMVSCTASASEDKIACCIELLLSRNADLNMADRWGRRADVFWAKMSTGFSPLSCVLSLPCWCRPSKKNSRLDLNRGRNNTEVLDRVSFDDSRYVWLPCGSIMHRRPLYRVYLCVLFGMSCYGMCTYRRVSDRQTTTHSVRSVPEDCRSICTHLDRTQ